MTVTAVTGSTRCGTTLMMRMLHLGGLPVYADNLVSCETSRVAGLPDDNGWLVDCQGRAVKLLEPLYLLPLPRTVQWRFILMRRDLHEQVLSQFKLLRLAGEDVRSADLPRFAAMLRHDYPRMLAALSRYGPVMEVRFEHLLAQPLVTAQRVARFLDVPLDTERMAAEVRPRSPACYPGLLEANLPELRGVVVGTTGSGSEG